ncbi:hypothetical protein DFH09DRAFT_903952 [Mycena vulgaris]|nr:hypothetical protein DFH09DRAFT_903952 [Mycena vulgaris]
MDQTNTGASLVSGIQDISAFLPIVGTEQCEKHVGEALTGGFLYAAATPLSMFGSLGIVKASAAILVASISPRVAQMLADAGFQLDGSNDQTKDIPQYIAAYKYQKLLEEQHIDKSQLTLVFDYHSWNWQLCISTGMLACLSITPYIPLILDNHPPSKSFPAWAFPLMRIVGSAVSVVVAQMIIQVQMQKILHSTSDGAAQLVVHRIFQAVKTYVFLGLPLAVHQKLPSPMKNRDLSQMQATRTAQSRVTKSTMEQLEGRFHCRLSLPVYISPSSKF